MKRSCAFIFLFLVAILPVWAQTGPVQSHSFLGGTTAKTQGLNSTNYLDGIIPAATITVYLHGTTNKATIYADNINTPLANPFTSNTLAHVDPGGWIFWAATGQVYDVVMSGGNSNPACNLAPLCYVQPVTLVVAIGGGGGGGGGCTTVGPAGTFQASNGIGGCQPAAIEVNGTNLIAPSPVNFVNSTTINFSNPSVGQITAVTVDPVLFKHDGTLLTGQFQATPQIYDYDETAIAPDSGDTVATFRANTASGKWNVEVPISNPIQMQPGGLPAGQHAIIFPSTCTPTFVAGTGIATCTASGGVNTGHASAFVTCSGGGALQPCGHNDVVFSNWTLPTGWNQANVTAVYPILYSQWQGPAQQLFSCTDGPHGTAGNILTLGPFGQTLPLPTFSGVPTVTSTTCTADSARTLASNVYSTMIVQEIALAVFDSVDPAPSAGTNLLVEAPLFYDPSINALGIAIPNDFAYDFGVANAYQVNLPGVVPTPQNYPSDGTHLTMQTSHANTSGTVTIQLNATTATSVTRFNGGALQVGDIIANVNQSYIFRANTLTWELQGAGLIASPPNYSFQYDLNGALGSDSFIKDDGTNGGGLVVNTTTFGDNCTGCAAFWNFGAGTPPSAPAANTLQIYAPASIATSYSIILPSSSPTSGAGALNCAGSSNPFSCVWSNTSVTGVGTTGFIPAWTSSSALGNSHCDDGVTTASTITCTEPETINASTLPSQIAITYDGHTPTVGSATTAVFASDSSGNGELSSGGAAFSLLCTQATGCPSSGSTAWSAITSGTNTNALLMGTGGTFGPTAGTTGIVSANQDIIFIANASSTGTTANTLTKLTGAPSTAVIAATTDTGGTIGITIAGAGTSGTATIQRGGLVNCVFSNATTAGDYVQISSGTGGDCADTGAATYPTSGQVIGRVLSTNGSAGTYQIDLFPAEIKAASGGGSGTNVNVNGGSTLTTSTQNGLLPYKCSDTSGSATAQSCTTTPSFTPTAGNCIAYNTTTQNSGALTLNVDSSAADAVQKWLGTALASGDMPANKTVPLCFDGTNWQMMTIGNAPSGSSGAMTNITSSLTWTGCTVSGNTCSPSAQSTVTMASIPGTYNSIIVKYIGTNSSDLQNFNCTVNSDTGNNYWQQGFETLGGAGPTTVNTGGIAHAFCGVVGTSASFSIVELPFYALTGVQRWITMGSGLRDGTQGNNFEAKISTAWTNTANAITSLSLTTTSGNFTGTFTVYGVN